MSRQKAMADGHKLQQEKVLLDIGKKNLHSVCGSNMGTATRDLGAPPSLVISKNQLDKALSDLT